MEVFTGYGKIYFNGETIRGNKHGMVSLESPLVLIPCEMDWLSYAHFGGFMFGKEDKLGMYESDFQHKYLAPEYSAYDISTLRFCRDGVWGWISRTTGEFFTEPIGERYDVMILATSADSFLNYEYKPKSEPKERTYISMEDFEEKLLEETSEFRKRLKVKLSSLIELPALKFAEGYVASERIVDAISSLSSPDERIVVTTGNNDAPDIHITFSKQDGRKVYRLEWSPRNNALAWYDAKLKEIEAFHQLILPGKDTFSMHFYRDFSAREVHAMAKFMVYYYSSIWHTTEEKLTTNSINQK